MHAYTKVNQQVYDTLAAEYKARVHRYLISDKPILAPFIDYLKHTFSHAHVLELGLGSGIALGKNGQKRNC